ncbi:MAG: hypothetical protein ACP5D7_18975 [Limnospira sp.]
MRTVDSFAVSGGLFPAFQNAEFDILVALNSRKPTITFCRQNFKHPIAN